MPEKVREVPGTSVRSQTLASGRGDAASADRVQCPHVDSDEEGTGCG